MLSRVCSSWENLSFAFAFFFVNSVPVVARFFQYAVHISGIAFFGRIFTTVVYPVFCTNRFKLVDSRNGYGSFGTLFLRSLSLHKPCKQLWRPNGRHIFHQGPLLRRLVLHSVHLLHTSMPLGAFLHFVPWELSLHPQVYQELHLKVGVSLLLLCRHLYLLFAPLCIC